MAVAVQIGTYEELQKIIADSDKEYDRERIEQAYLLAAEKHREQRRSSGEPILSTPVGGGNIGGPRYGFRIRYGGAAARRGGGYRLRSGRDREEVRERGGSAGRRRYQAGKDPFFFQRRAAGGKPAKNAHGHGGGYPGHYHQICRPHA